MLVFSPELALLRFFAVISDVGGDVLRSSDALRTDAERRGASWRPPIVPDLQRIRARVVAFLGLVQGQGDGVCVCVCVC